MGKKRSRGDCSRIFFFSNLHFRFLALIAIHSSSGVMSNNPVPSVLANLTDDVASVKQSSSIVDVSIPRR